MKRLIIFVVIVMLGNSIYAQKETFYKKVVNDLDCRGDCYFLSLEIVSESYSGRVVVENNYLFDYLRTTKGFDRPAYESFMLKFFRENQKLTMPGVIREDRGIFLIGKDVKDLTFRIAETSQAVETIAQRGCKYLIQYYFVPLLKESKENENCDCKQYIKQNARDLLMKNSVGFVEQSNVISKLFDMEIPIQRDDISGSLRIAYATLH